MLQSNIRTLRTTRVKDLGQAMAGIEDARQALNDALTALYGEEATAAIMAPIERGLAESFEALDKPLPSA